MRCIGCLLLLVALAGAVNWDTITALDEYVNRPDDNLAYTEIASYPGEGHTVYVFNMTSLKWMNDSIVYYPVWEHFLAIAIPDEVRFKDAAYLRVGNKYNGDSAPTPENDSWIGRIGDFAKNVGAVAAYLKMVPNQPTFFVADPLPRIEDSIIGYTWRVFIEEDIPEPEIIVQFPMTKCAKLAMDVVTEVAAEKNPEIQIDKYFPSGASKRGWVSWLLGAVDKRVFAMAPLVMDLLNFVPSLEHHYRSLGGWSWAFLPYWLEGVSRYLYHPRAKLIGSYIDPFVYNERLTMPKLIVVATGDQFFLPDGSHTFFDVLNGQNYMMVLENTDHSHNLHADRLFNNIQAFFVSVLTGYEMPTLNWQRSETVNSGSIMFSTNTPPTLVRAWRADTTNYTGDRRDFRMNTVELTNPIVWAPEAIEDLGDGVYRVEYDKTETGWRGFFVEAQFEGPDGMELHFTSEINMIPDVLPYERCWTEDECVGIIV